MRRLGLQCHLGKFIMWTVQTFIFNALKTWGHFHKMSQVLFLVTFIKHKFKVLLDNLIYEKNDDKCIACLVKESF